MHHDLTTSNQPRVPSSRSKPALNFAWPTADPLHKETQISFFLGIFLRSAIFRSIQILPHFAQRGSEFRGVRLVLFPPLYEKPCQFYDLKARPQRFTRSCSIVNKLCLLPVSESGEDLQWDELDPQVVPRARALRCKLTVQFFQWLQHFE